MAVIIYQGEGGLDRKLEFGPEELRIGSEAGRNQLLLPADCGAAAEHAVITRTVIGKLPVLVDLTGHGLRVNGQPVIALKVLHHGDTIDIGGARLMLREMQIKRLPADPRASRKKCPFCTDDLRGGDEVIACPNCGVLHHRECWFQMTLCSTDGCQYPIHETVMKALSPSCTFISKLEPESKLVVGRQECPAGRPKDLVPFQKEQDVAFCPSCEAPFHLDCWLCLPVCPRCRYDVKSLIDEVFDAEVAVGAPSQEGGA